MSFLRSQSFTKHSSSSSSSIPCGVCHFIASGFVVNSSHTPMSSTKAMHPFVAGNASPTYPGLTSSCLPICASVFPFFITTVFCLPCSYWLCVIADTLYMPCPSHPFFQILSRLGGFLFPISSFHSSIFHLSSRVALHILLTQSFTATCNFSSIPVSHQGQVQSQRNANYKGKI